MYFHECKINYIHHLVHLVCDVVFLLFWDIISNFLFLFERIYKRIPHRIKKGIYHLVEQEMNYKMICMDSIKLLVNHKLVGQPQSGWSTIKWLVDYKGWLTTKSLANCKVVGQIQSGRSTTNWSVNCKVVSQLQSGRSTAKWSVKHKVIGQPQTGQLTTKSHTKCKNTTSQKYRIFQKTNIYFLKKLNSFMKI